MVCRITAYGYSDCSSHRAWAIRIAQVMPITTATTRPVAVTRVVCHRSCSSWERNAGS